MLRDPYKRDARLGRWRIGDKDMASYMGFAAMQGAIQRSALIIEVRREWAREGLECFGLCPEFDIVEIGCEVPTYRPVFGADKEHGTRVVKWEKVDG